MRTAFMGNLETLLNKGAVSEEMGIGKAEVAADVLGEESQSPIGHKKKRSERHDHNERRFSVLWVRVRRGYLVGTMGYM